jgi:hypothetical protein
MTEREDERAPRENGHGKKPRLNLTTSQVAASALAACCASIVASYLGVAGTVIGAAVGSIIATTGAAIWGHLFRTGGDKIKQTLLVNGELVEVETESAEAQPVPAGRFYGTDAATTAKLWTPKGATAETRVVGDETKVISPPDEKRRTRLARFLKYRKPMGIAAAVVAVFSISIVVGMLAGAPVRSAGSSTAPSTTTTTTVTETTQGKVGDGSSASSSSSASHGSSATASSSASPSSSATNSSSASSAASPSASASTGSGATATNTPQAQGATSTGSP